MVGIPQPTCSLEAAWNVTFRGGTRLLLQGQCHIFKLPCILHCRQLQQAGLHMTPHSTQRGGGELPLAGARHLAHCTCSVEATAVHAERMLWVGGEAAWVAWAPRGRWWRGVDVVLGLLAGGVAGSAGVGVGIWVWAGGLYKAGRQLHTGGTAGRASLLGGTRSDVTPKHC